MIGLALRCEVTPSTNSTARTTAVAFTPDTTTGSVCTGPAITTPAIGPGHTVPTPVGTITGGAIWAATAAAATLGFSISPAGVATTTAATFGTALGITLNHRS